MEASPGLVPRPGLFWNVERSKKIAEVHREAALKTAPLVRLDDEAVSDKREASSSRVIEEVSK